MNLHRICEQAGVRLRPAADYTPSLRQPGECYCAPALKQVAERHGEAHLRLTLRLFGGTEANRMALYADAIKALASVIADPAVAARRDLVYAVDAIDLLALRRKAKGLPAGDVGPQDRLTVSLAIILHKKDSPDED